MRFVIYNVHAVLLTCSLYVLFTVDGVEVIYFTTEQELRLISLPRNTVFTGANVAEPTPFVIWIEDDPSNQIGYRFDQWQNKEPTFFLFCLLILIFVLAVLCIFVELFVRFYDETGYWKERFQVCKKDWRSCGDSRFFRNNFTDPLPENQNVTNFENTTVNRYFEKR